MGNRGMTNWKLGAFFIISLMLCAGLFSNTAMAADGAGKVMVGWSGVAATAPTTVNAITGTAVDGEVDNTLPLNAGTRYNVVQITYTAEAADKMGGGLVRIDLPGWALPAIAANLATTNVTEKDFYQSVLITSDANGPTGGTDPPLETLYATSDTGLAAPLVPATAIPGSTAVALSEAQKDAFARVVTLTKDRVEVVLDSNWNYGGELVITLGNIESGVPSHLPSTDAAQAAPQPFADYQLTASSKAKNGTLVSLDTQANVRVGNIAGTRTAAQSIADPDIAKDKLNREFTITPTIVYQGEMKRNFEITFKVPGPMYNVGTDESNIQIAIPDGLRPDGSSTVSVSSSGPGIGAPYFNGVATTISVPVSTDVQSITVPVTTGVNKDQTITVRYTADIEPAAATDFTLAELDTKVGAGGPTDATKYTGGMVDPLAGSGDVKLSPDVSAVSTPRTFQVTYTALTDLENATLVIRPEGIVIADDTTTATVEEKLFDTTSTYGYVRAASGSAKGSLTVPYDCYHSCCGWWFASRDSDCWQCDSMGGSGSNER